MKQISLIIAVFCWFNLFSQNNDFKISLEIDPFTNDSIYTSSWAAFNVPTWKGANSHVRFKSLKSQGVRVYVMNVRIITESIVTVSEGTDFLVKLEDETIIKLKTMSDVVSGKGEGTVGFMGSALFGVSLNFILSVEDLERMSVIKFSACRLDSKDWKLDIIPEKAKYQQQVQLAASKFFNYMKNKR